MPTEEGATWIEDAELHPLTSARLLALKVLTNRCIPFANTDSSTTVATPVFGLLWKLVESGRDDLDGESAVSSRLRLASTLGVLKLLTTKDPAFLKNAIQHFALLSRTAQVSSDLGPLSPAVLILLATLLYRTRASKFEMDIFASSSTVSA
jgi:sister-chromatid-cohesion protein PDS5